MRCCNKPVRLEELIKHDLKRNFCSDSFPHRKMYYLLLVDFWLGTLVVNPLATAVVRGSWQNLDQFMLYIMPKSDKLDIANLCFAVGCLISFFMHLVNHYLARRVTPDASGRWLSRIEVRFVVVSRLFTVTLFYGNIFIWKGMWDILDNIYETYEWRVSVSLTGGVLVYLTFVGSLRTVMGTPLGTGFVADIDVCYLYIPTMWMMELDSPLLHRVVDCCLTLMLLILSIIAYHSLWRTEEKFIAEYAEKQQQEITRIGVELCLVCGSVGISTVSFVSEFFLLWLHAQDVPDIVKLGSYQAMLAMNYFADVTIFVALWRLQMELIVPENQVISSLISHLVGLFTMLILGVANTLHGGFERERYRMVDGILIPRFYFTYFFRRLTNTKNKSTQT